MTLGSALPYCNAQPESPHHKSPDVRDALARTVGAVVEQMHPDGWIMLGGQTQTAFAHSQKLPVEPHGQAWFLISLLTADALVGPDWEPGFRQQVHAKLLKAAEVLNTHPSQEINNRSTSQAAALAMAAQHFGRADFMQTARQIIEHTTADFTAYGIFGPAGQILEDGGPDANYTYVTALHAYLYWRFSGDERMTEPLWRFMRWHNQWTTHLGQFFLSASTRMRNTASPRHGFIAPLWERFAEREPWLYHRFAELAEQQGGFLPFNESEHISPLIFALIEHRKTHALVEQMPDWLSAYDTLCYNSDGAGYSYYRLLGTPTFRTNLVIRAHFPLNGLQSFQFRNQSPLAYPTECYASDTVARGFSSAHLRVSSYPESGNRTATFFGKQDPVKWMGMYRGHGWDLYVWTPHTLVQLIVTDNSSMQTQWCLSKRVHAQPPVLAENTVRRADASAEAGGRLRWAQGQGRLEENEEAYLLLIDHEAGVNACAFTSGAFDWLDRDLADRTFAFRDASGAWQITWHTDGGWHESPLTVERRAE